MAVARNVGRRSLILVVNDNEAGQMLVRAVRQLAGLKVDTASSGNDVSERSTPKSKRGKRRQPSSSRR